MRRSCDQRAKGRSKSIRCLTWLGLLALDFHLGRGCAHLRGDRAEATDHVLITSSKVYGGAQDTKEFEIAAASSKFFDDAPTYMHSGRGGVSDEELIADFVSKMSGWSHGREGTNQETRVDEGGWDSSNLLRWINDRSPSRDSLLPFCGLVAPLVNLELFCPALGFAEREILGTRLVRSIVTNPVTIFTTMKEPANEPDGSLPKLLINTTRPTPFIIADRIVAAERHTYYWYYRVILNLYTYTRRLALADDNPGAVVEPPYVPTGWTESCLLYLRTEEGTAPPLGQVLYKARRMLVVLRGTVTYVGYVQDLDYSYADKWRSEQYGLRGRQHEGFFNASQQMWPLVMAELRRNPQVDTLTITGQSLGAAVGILLAAFVALDPSTPKPIRIEVVAIGTPQVGDREFAEQYDSLPIEARRLLYLGQGLKTSKGPYGIGDVVAQLPPPCYGIPGCERGFALPRDNTDRYYYAMTGGTVIVRAEALPNPHTWRRKERLLTADSSVMACHMCVYLCWAVQGLHDAEDRCYFQEEPEAAVKEQAQLCPWDTNLGGATADVTVLTCFPGLRGHSL